MTPERVVQLVGREVEWTVNGAVDVVTIVRSVGVMRCEIRTKAGNMVIVNIIQLGELFP